VLKLRAGKHRVTVSPPNKYNWLARAWSDEVMVTHGDTTAVQAVFTRSYAIRSEPFGAAVYMDGVHIGTTPFQLTLPENEAKNLTLTRTGYLDTTFAVGMSDRVLFDVSLRQARHISEQLLNQARPGASPTVRKLIYAGVGLAAFSGGMALYFRSRANDRFDRYKRTGNPALFNKFYDDARKFDKFATGSFAVFQVSFIATFALFLRELNR